MNENTNLTPRKIVEYLDQYIIGQSDAKRSVAVALRNRWRASRLTPEMAKEVSPKNILLIGPTGVGKTEIARRIAEEQDAVETPRDPFAVETDLKRPFAPKRDKTIGFWQIQRKLDRRPCRVRFRSAPQCRRTPLT